MTLRFALRGIGVLAPGLPGWHAARDVLAGAAPWRDVPVATPEVRQLPVTERRRVNATSRWAIAVAEEAAAGLDDATRASMSAVFASEGGDGDVLEQSLRALAAPDPTLSPTLFHNSVFNAPVGYWSIATRSTGWATMLCGGESSVAAALLEAASQAHASRGAVLCVAVDLAFPERLAGLRAPGRPYACAVVIDANPATGGSLGSIDVGGDRAAMEDDRMPDPVAQAFRGNAAAASIPLLARVARRASGAVLLPDHDGRALRVSYVAP